jgi:hypothetical protein
MADGPVLKTGSKSSRVRCDRAPTLIPRRRAALFEVGSGGRIKGVRRVSHTSNVATPPLGAKPARLGHLAAVTVLTALATTSPPARALDGCLVLLCLAAPNWRAIPECVPPIRQLLSDLARGRPFPTCAMAGAGNTARHQWASAPEYCPPQYVGVVDTESGPSYSCRFAGAVTVEVNGAPWSRTWWSSGDTVTEFFPAARAQFDAYDTRFDADYAAWIGSWPAPAPEAP